MKNKIVSIGYLGFKRCYLNVSKEEAIRRYIEAEGELQGDVEEFEFVDEFYSYDGGSRL